MTITTQKIQYKKTGLDWMPEVPEHWEIIKLKHFSSLKARIGFHGLSSTDFIDEGPYCITGTDFSNGQIDFSNCYHVSDYWYHLDINIQIVNGDILVTKDGTIGKIAIVSNLNQKATLNSGVFVLRVFDKLDSSYFFWLLHSQFFKVQIDFIKRGTTINHLYERDFKNFHFPVPPKDEQDEIVQYIKAKEEKINLFIQKKQRFIELLKEQRQSIVFKTVTKGISANVPFKETNIDWIGKIPTHWELKRMKNLCKISNGMDCEKEDVGEFPVYGSGGVFGWTNNFIYNKPSVLLGRKGTIDKPIFVTEPFWTVDTAFFTKIFEEAIEPSFFYPLCCCIPFESLSTKTALPSMTQTALYQVKMPVPPIDEQKQIVSHIKTETATIDNAIAKAEREIELIREYKEAMIAEAVMGKM